jgi:rhodanese-related sulfurtransferase
MLAIPDLNIKTPLSENLAQTPVVKMKRTGAFPYQIGGINGTITVIVYHQTNYREVSADQGAAVIAGENPLILDVRTPKEFKSGHLDGAVLIPVQQLASHIGKIAAHKDRPVFVYCATGNRSTVASKILIDKGFGQVINLRHGIYDWTRRRHKVVK